MTASPPQDPVARPRRWVKYGSMALVAATLLPSMNLEIFVLNLHTLQMFAWGVKRPHGYSEIQRHLMWVFSAYAWPILLSGWIGLAISRKPERPSGAPPQRILRFARALFFATWILPCLNALAYHQRFHAFGPLPLACGLLSYGTLGYALRALAERHAGTPRIVLGYLALPVTATLAGWICIAILFHRLSFYLLVMPIGLVGAWATFVGFVRWWQVLQESNGAVASTRDPAEGSARSM